MGGSVDRTLLDAATTGEAKFVSRKGAVPQQGFHHHIKWASGVTLGEVQIECAEDATYTGTWAPMGTITFSGVAPKQDYLFTPGQPKAIRHRISTTVSGGSTPSVTTKLIGVA